MSRNFVDDIKWRLDDLTISLCAIGPAEAAMMVIRPFSKSSKHARWVVYFDRSEDGIWIARRGTSGIQAYDVTGSGPFVELPSLPQEVPAAIRDALDQLKANDSRVVALGRDRLEHENAETEERVREQTASALRRVKFAMAEHGDHKARLQTFGRRYLGEAFSIKEIEPSWAREAHQSVVDFDFGPMVLTISGPDTFTLSTPGQAPMIDDAGVARKFDAEWSAGRWRNAPSNSPSMMEKIDRAAVFVRTEYADIFEEVTRSMLANRLAELEIDMEALSRYETFLEDAVGATPSAEMRP